MNRCLILKAADPIDSVMRAERITEIIEILVPYREKPPQELPAEYSEVHPVSLSDQAQTDTESPHYDIPSFRKEVEGWFDGLCREYRWRPVLLRESGSFEKLFPARQDLIYFNLCDGGESDGYPGISVLKTLEKNGCFYTGCESAFFVTSTYKWEMKKRMRAAGVSASEGYFCANPEDIPALCSEMPADFFPVILKLNSGAGGSGLDFDSVVNNHRQLEEKAIRIFAGFEEALRDGILAERYIAGREFTVLILPDGKGDYSACPAVEYIYHPLVPENMRIISSEEWRLPIVVGGEKHKRMTYATAPVADDIHCRDLALRAFHACGGSGYARVDIRKSDRTGEYRVLEVNANCTLSEAEPTISLPIGAMKLPMKELISRLCREALSKTRKTADV